MSTITFDTLALTTALTQFGIEQKQAEVIVKAQSVWVTRDYFDSKLAPLCADLMLLKWMLGVLLASVVSLMVTAIF